MTWLQCLHMNELFNGFHSHHSQSNIQEICISITYRLFLKVETISIESFVMLLT